MAVTVCDVEFGYWVCGESWLAIKDSFTHRPRSQGWVLLSFHVICICVCVFCMDILGFVYICWWWFLFISLSIYLSTYDWYAMNYNFMYVKTTRYELSGLRFALCCIVL